jgi:2-keto-4-pentenoate hydratase/2-oxohepta-3-ene-1,7-dioic acid hydratase in catechol pathway
MKFLRFGPMGQEKPGILDRQGRIRDLSGLIDDITPETIAAGRLEAIAKTVNVAKLPVVRRKVRIGPCIARTGNFIAIGLNYAEHATETDAAIPTEPILFNKAPSCLSGPYDDVVLPPGSVKSDWEVELALVIGRKTFMISEEEALSTIAGYCICNDVSEREYQLEREGQWVKGKCFPTFGPLGPWLVTPDEVPDPQNLALWMDVNGERIQNAHTHTMIFPIRRLIAEVSRYMVLNPGDVITTGTPPGVGLGFRPPRYLKAGDTMRLSVEGLGEQSQRVVPFPGPLASLR